MSGKSELKIFDDHPPQVVVQSAYFEEMHPQGSLENDDTIEFYIPASNTDYLDLNDTLLTVNVSVVYKSGARLKADDKTPAPVPSDFFMYTLFSDVTLSLNDTVIEGGESLYPYKAYITSLLNLPSDARESELMAIGNEDVDKRQNWIKESKSAQFTGTLRLDFFSQPKYLIPGVSVRIKVKKSSPGFALCYKSGDPEPAEGTWKIIYEMAVLYVRRVKVHPAVLKAHTFGMQTRNALYPYTSSRIVSLTVANGVTSYVKDNLFSFSILPKVVVIGLVKTSAAKGTVKHRSLYFRDFSASKVALFRDGQGVPYKNGYSCELTHHHTDIFARNLQNINGFNQSSALRYKDFTAGSQLYVFNLTPDFDMKERQMLKDSNLRLELEFKDALPESINVIAFACYDTTLQITTGGQILRNGFT